MGCEVLERLEVLDHGFVELLDVMGSDEDIEQAARVSYTGGKLEVARTVEQRRNLIRYLMRHRHTTPFEMAELKFRIALPIVVERQWIRHRTSSTNEFSGRYAEMPDLFYVPEEDRIRKQSTSNKQGSGDPFDAPAKKALQFGFKNEQQLARDKYEARFEAGMAKELARLNLPLTQYTVKVWKLNLHNLLHFLGLRMHPHAQWEIRQYANAIAKMVERRFPLTWEAFEDYRMDAVTFSGPEMRVLNRWLFRGGDAYAMMKREGLSNREREEFWAKLEKVDD